LGPLEISARLYPSEEVGVAPSLPSGLGSKPNHAITIMVAVKTLLSSSWPRYRCYFRKLWLPGNV